MRRERFGRDSEGIEREKKQVEDNWNGEDADADKRGEVGLVGRPNGI